MSLFSLYTSYTVSIENKKVYPAPALLRIDDRGIIISTSKNHKFMINSTVYTRLRKDCVINLCPYVPVNDSDERSCYSTLLVHIPWPSGGEEELLRGCDCAVECLYDLKRNGDIPSYVNYTLELLHNSNLIRENVGTNITDSGESTDEYLYNNSSDENSYVIDESHIAQFGDSISIPVNSSNLSTECLINLTAANMRYCQNFIQTIQNKHIENLRQINSIQSTSISDDITCGCNIYCRVDNHDERLNTLQLNVGRLTQQQLKAYNIAVEYISGEKNSQMLMFVTGEGGTGKSFLISLIMEYTQICHGKQKGLYGSALAIAPTGAAASVISGYTWQSVYGKGRIKKKSKVCNMSKECAQAVGSKISGVKLIVLDEISMINLQTLNEISERQIAAMGTQTSDPVLRNSFKSKHFGGVHMLFTGDFYQLRPIDPEAIYTSNIKHESSIKGRQIWQDLNEYVVLTENTRYMHDTTPIMNVFLSGARKGNVNQELLHAINSRVCVNERAARREAGPDAVWIAHENKIVRRLNKTDFEEKMSNGVLSYKLIARHLPVSKEYKLPDKEAVDAMLLITRYGSPSPYLDLAIGTKVSCTMNLGTQIGEHLSCFSICYKNLTGAILQHTLCIQHSLIIYNMYMNYLGIFNGAKGKVVAFAFSYDPDIIANDQQSSYIQKELPVVFVQMDNDIGYSVIPSIPNVIPFTEQCDVTERYGKYYFRWQIPLVAAFATTTHKMQGSTVKGNCVTIPSLKAPWARGLDYVANSRATELSKLFLIRPLKEQHFTSHAKEREIIDQEYFRLSRLFRL